MDFPYQPAFDAQYLLRHQLQSTDGTVPQSSNSSIQAIQEPIAPLSEVLESTSPAQKKNTPSHIEVLLRRYNGEGVTKWDDILNRLTNEDPPIDIGRSTLGKYLKDCNIGTSRRATMGDDETRQHVLDDLNEHQGERRGVRKVWESLKAKGHHIKRDFVEGVMRDVNPGGFLERRPRWKSLRVEPADPGPYTSGSSIGRPSSPIPSADPAIAISTESTQSSGLYTNAQTLPQYSNHRVPLRVDPVINLFPLGTHSDNHIPSHNGRGPGDSTLSKEGVEMDDQESSSDSDSISDDISETAQTIRESTQVEHQESAAVSNFKSTGQWFGVHSNMLVSRYIGMIAKGSNSSMKARTSGQVFWEAISTADKEEQRTQIQRLQLKNTVKELLIILKDWLTDTSASIPMPACRPTITNTLIPSGDTQIGKPYIPNYKLSEDQITTDTLYLALRLRCNLSSPKSPINIVLVADQLSGLRGRLWDIGMPLSLCIDVGLLHLDVVEEVQHVYGPQDWVLQDVWFCTTDCVYELDCGCMRDISYRQQLKAIAKKAADVAQLLSCMPSAHAEFYHASSLHYASIRLRYNYDNIHEYKKENRKSIFLFLKAVPLYSQYEHVREMMRTLVAYDMGKFPNDENILVFNHILMHAHNTRDPAIAKLSAKTIHNLPLSWCPRIDEPLIGNHDICNTMSFIAKQAIKVLRCFQNARPSQLQTVLACALAEQAVSSRSHGCYQDVTLIFEEAITIQQRATRFGDKEAVNQLAEHMADYVKYQCSFQHWKDASHTACRLVQLIRHFSGYGLEGTLLACLYQLDESVQSNHGPQFLYVARQVIDTFQSVLGKDCPPIVFSDWLADFMIKIANGEREWGAFRVAFKVSLKALEMSRNIKCTDTYDKKMCNKVLACHALCIVDSGKYKVAISLLEEATVALEDEQDTLLELLPRFGMVHAYSHKYLNDSPGIDKMLEVPYMWNSRDTPCWLSIENHECKNAWLLLIHTVMHISSPIFALKSAEKSHTLLLNYYSDNTEPHIQASVLGHMFVLLCIMHREADTVLDKTVALYRSILAFSQSEHCMARLPLLVFLDILLVLFQNLPTPQPAISQLKAWKKKVYNGSTSFFEDFVVFLQDLPSCV